MPCDWGDEDWKVELLGSVPVTNTTCNGFSTSRNFLMNASSTARHTCSNYFKVMFSKQSEVHTYRNTQLWFFLKLPTQYSSTTAAADV